MKKKRNRLFIDKKTSSGEREKIIYLAAENGCNTLVFSMDDRYFRTINLNQKYIKLIKTHAIRIEAGGHELPMLLPKRLFLFNRELFRMEHGSRKSDHHFCPTNPKTISIISEQAGKLFSRLLPKMTAPRLFHLLPDVGFENKWCACPACRAFSPAEQYLITINTAADALAKIDNEARITYANLSTDPDIRGISPRKNLIISSHLT